MNLRHVLTVIACALALATSISAQQNAMPSDEAIRAILRTRIDTEARGVGIVVGVVEPGGRRVIAHGSFGAKDPRPVDGDTLFEIGSITKVFTSLLLADMAGRGEVQLNDPVAKYLPASVRVPDRDGREITLQDLATHTSGLPRLPTNLVVTSPDNPYANYNVERLYEFLSGHTLSRAIGAQYEYSNLGGGLLGHALALRAGSDYESLARTRIFAPLGMNDTTIRMSLTMSSRLAAGHDPQRGPAGNWDFTTALAGAGAIRSTANDMMRFVAAFMGSDKQPFSAAAARMLSVQRPGPGPGSSAALGWIVTTRDDLTMVWHGGATGGYSAFAGYIPARGTGVVLSNMAATPAVSPDDIGMHLLDERFPLSRPQAARTRITLPTEILQRYVGRYELAPGFIATVTLEGGRLFVQPSNQPRHEIHAEAEREFFATLVDAQFTFEVDASGKAVAMVLHQAGRNVSGKRLTDGAASAPPASRPHITLEPAVLDQYVGRYQLTAAMFITVTREDTRLFAQASGQGRFELFAEAPERFFADVGGIEIAFDRDGGGRATSLTIRQAGTAFQLKRVE